MSQPCQPARSNETFQQWQEALKLFEEMQNAGVQPNVAGTQYVQAAAGNSNTGYAAPGHGHNAGAMYGLAVLPRFARRSASPTTPKQGC